MQKQHHALMYTRKVQQNSASDTSRWENFYRQLLFDFIHDFIFPFEAPETCRGREFKMSFNILRVCISPEWKFWKSFILSKNATMEGRGRLLPQSFGARASFEITQILGEISFGKGVFHVASCLTYFPAHKPSSQLS